MMNIGDSRVLIWRQGQDNFVAKSPVFQNDEQAEQWGKDYLQRKNDNSLTYSLEVTDSVDDNANPDPDPITENDPIKTIADAIRAYLKERDMYFTIENVKDALFALYADAELTQEQADSIINSLVITDTVKLELSFKRGKLRDIKLADDNSKVNAISLPNVLISDSNKKYHIGKTQIIDSTVQLFSELPKSFPIINKIWDLETIGDSKEMLISLGLSRSSAYRQWHELDPKVKDQLAKVGYLDINKINNYPLILSVTDSGDTKSYLIESISDAVSHFTVNHYLSGTSFKSMPLNRVRKIALDSKIYLVKDTKALKAISGRFKVLDAMGKNAELHSMIDDIIRAIVRSTTIFNSSFPFEKGSISFKFTPSIRLLETAIKPKDGRSKTLKPFRYNPSDDEEEDDNENLIRKYIEYVTKEASALGGITEAFKKMLAELKKNPSSAVPKVVKEPAGDVKSEAFRILGPLGAIAQKATAGKKE